MNLCCEHRNWAILLSKTDQKWSYICCPPGGEPLISCQLYLDQEIALAEAKSFIDRMVCRCDLGKWLDELLDNKRITSQEYNRCDQLISQMINIKTSDYLAID
jgi:hypothetical protein